MINVKLTALRKLILVLLLLSCPLVSPSLAQERAVVLRGRVVDANTGEAMANVRVVAKLTDKTTITVWRGLKSPEIILGHGHL